MVTRPCGDPRSPRAPHCARGWPDSPSTTKCSCQQARSTTLHRIVKGVPVSQINLGLPHIPSRQWSQLPAPPFAPRSQSQPKEFFRQRGEGPALGRGKLFQLAELYFIKNQGRALHMKNHTPQSGGRQTTLLLSCGGVSPF